MFKKIVDGIGKSISSQKVKSTPGEGTYYELEGIKLPYDNKIISGSIEKSIKSGGYERKEAFQTKAIIQEKESVLEIGGGIGYISSLIAKNKQVEKIYVVEANPNLIPYMKKVHKINGVDDAVRMEVLNAVLTNKISAGEHADFYLRENFWASSLSPTPQKYLDVIKVPLYSFNTIVENVKPTLIVCDIEGGETELFEHANLTGVEKVLIELHQWVVGRRNVKKLFDYFSSRNFHYDQRHSSGSVVLFSHVDRDKMRKERLAVAQQKQLNNQQV